VKIVLHKHKPRFHATISMETLSNLINATKDIVSLAASFSVGLPVLLPQEAAYPRATFHSLCLAATNQIITVQLKPISSAIPSIFPRKSSLNVRHVDYFCGEEHREPDTKRAAKETTKDTVPHSIEERRRDFGLEIFLYDVRAKENTILCGLRIQQ
jgi:hypothetical protein